MVWFFRTTSFKVLDKSRHDIFNNITEVKFYSLQFAFSRIKVLFIGSSNLRVSICYHHNNWNHSFFIYWLIFLNFRLHNTITASSNLHFGGSKMDFSIPTACYYFSFHPDPTGLKPGCLIVHCLIKTDGLIGENHDYGERQILFKGIFSQLQKENSCSSVCL